MKKVARDNFRRSPDASEHGRANPYIGFFVGQVFKIGIFRLLMNGERNVKCKIKNAKVQLKIKNFSKYIASNMDFVTENYFTTTTFLKVPESLPALRGLSVPF